MSENKTIKLGQAAKEFNVSIGTIVEYLQNVGFEVDRKPNTKLDSDAYNKLLEKFQPDKVVKEQSNKISIGIARKESLSLDENAEKAEKKAVNEDLAEDLIINTSLTNDTSATKEEKEEKEEKESQEKMKAETKEVETAKKEEEDKNHPKPKVVGKIDLDKDKKKKAAEKQREEEAKEQEKAKEEKIEEGVVQKEDKTVADKEIEEEKAVAKEEKEEVKTEKVEDKKEETAKTEEKSEEKQTEESEAEKADDNFIQTEFRQLSGPKVLGKMDLPVKEEKKKEHKKPVASSSSAPHDKKKKRKRIKKDKTEVKKKEENKPTKGKKKQARPEVSEEDIQKQIKETLSKLTGAGKSKASKHRRQKRELVHQRSEQEKEHQEQEKKTIKATEFVTANELATMMDASVNDVISTCMTLGLFVSINQRLDAETIALVADEFGYDVDFVSAEDKEIKTIEDKGKDEDYEDRPPIVTVMGHVDHGKTSLLDYIRHTKVIEGEAGGITQHIGAYKVKTTTGKIISFLDTPGHEAFTAMRARGAQVTDIAIIVIAADDKIMPQTKEAINHAQAAGVPIVIAINKIDKPNANPEKIKEELAALNILVEDWGGKYQSQEISAKHGTNVDQLLEKVLLEAELLELKGNPKVRAKGTVIESSLDKGKGYVATLLVQNGSLKLGDILIAGTVHGKVKAMYNELNKKLDQVGPSCPALVLGLNGAPQAGDIFNVMEDEREAKNIANKREQLQREQGLRTQKHITLDEIGRRIAIGDFKELNIIVKGDVDGSVEALSDSLLKLTNEEVQVNVIHKSVGQITETDVMLASASNAVIIGFQVRPSLAARKLAEHEEIDIRLYSVIYKCIEEIQAAIEGMLSPDIKEEIVCNIEVRDIFKITKVGTVAGCMVLDGKIHRNTKIRVIRDGIIIYTGVLGSLKRHKDDVKEVSAGYECGLNIENFNDIKVGDIVEGYEEVEVKRSL
jgi:translation initiation factor IF-2